MVVNPMKVSNQLTLIPRDELPEGVAGNQLGTPYSHPTVRFMSPLSIPCNEPPYGVLAAIDLETKELLWEKPLGSAKESGPNIPTPFGDLFIKSRLRIPVGTPGIGGTVTTAGGLIFSASSFDNTVRATDLFTGEELWYDDLPFTAHATPTVYESPSGQQTLIVTVPVFNSTSGAAFSTLAPEDEDPEGGYIFAYRLPVPVANPGD